MTPENYIWKKLASEDLLKTPYYGVRRDRLRHPQGHDLDYYVLQFAKQAVGIVPIDSNGRILLVQQWRHPVEKLTWSIPAGGIDTGETPMQAAARELREETGHAAGNLQPLYSYHPTIGVSDQTFHLFLAQELTQAGVKDEQEILQTRFFTRPEVKELLNEKQIIDGLSLSGLLLVLG